MKTRLFCTLLILFSTTACKNAQELIEKIGTTYSADNSTNWTTIEPNSSALAGLCSIENGKIIYKKINADFNSFDSCQPSTSNCEEYQIDFSDPNPTLTLQITCV